MSANEAVGVIGLGIIGSRVARNLRQKGFDVRVWNRTKKNEEGFVDSLPELAAKSTVIQVFVSNDAAVLETVAQLRPALTSAHLVTLHSTISPKTAEKVKDEIHSTGAAVIDAPFTGSKGAAANGRLVYYVAGNKPAVDRARPVLQASSKTMLFLDKFGDASAVKIATNLISAAIVEALAEALAIVEGAGVDPHKFAEAVEMNACRSGVSDLKLKSMIEGDFEPSFSLRNMLKDSRLALDLGAQCGVELPATRAVERVLDKGHRLGLDDKDYAVVAQIIKNNQKTDS